MAALLGCPQPKESPPASAAGASTPAPAVVPGPVITLLESDAGKTIALTRGQELFIRLNSNRTTGYSWVLARSGTNALRSLGEAVYTPEATGAAGAGGIESWSFKAGENGEEELLFEYRRP